MWTSRSSQELRTVDSGPGMGLECPGFDCFCGSGPEIGFWCDFGPETDPKSPKLVEFWDSEPTFDPQS